MKLKYPDYDKCLVNFANSLLKKFGVEQYHSSLEQIDNLLNRHDKIVILLFDGMGKNLINRHLSKGAFLPYHRIMTITSVFPSTTAAATNSLLSGRFPIESGWLGWAQYFKEHDAIIEVFNGNDYYQKKPIVTPKQIIEVIGYENIFQTIKKHNPNLLVETVWPAIKLDGASNIDQFFNQLEQQTSKQGPKLIYGYWTDPDSLAHEHGINHFKIKNSLSDINEKVEELTKKHADTLFLVLADHGIIDVEFTRLSRKGGLEKMVSIPFSIEPRATSIFVTKNKHKKFKRIFNKYHGSQFMLKTKQEIIEEQIFGLGQAHQRSMDFIGDFIAIAIDKYCLASPLVNEDKHVKAHHAGLTEEEMLIDIMAINV